MVLEHCRIKLPLVTRSQTTHVWCVLLMCSDQISA